MARTIFFYRLKLYLMYQNLKLWFHWLNIQIQIFNNFGRRKNDPAKDRKALETYVSLKGYKQGGNGSNQYMQSCQNGTFAKSTIDEIAKELNMSKRYLQRALRIKRNLTDSMKELLNTGEITKVFPYKTFASDTIATLLESQKYHWSKIFSYHLSKVQFIVHSP